MPTLVKNADLTVSLVVTGANFASHMTVQIDRMKVPYTEFINSGEFRSNNFDQSRYAEGVHLVRVGSSAYWSNEVPFTIGSVTSPPVAPVLNSLTPSQIDPPATDPTKITLTGLNFAAGCGAYFDGVAVPTTIISNSTAEILVPASMLPGNSAHTVKIGYVSQGIWSNEKVFIVTPPPPFISSLSPVTITSAQAADGETVTITGGYFLTAPTVAVDGVSKASTFVSASSITVALAAADLATGDHTVKVTNTDGKSSNVMTLTVEPPAPPADPTLTSLTPASINRQMMADPTIVVLKGTNFRDGMVAKIDGGAALRSLTFVSATEMHLSVPRSLVSTAKTYTVEVGMTGETFTASKNLVVTAVNPTMVSVTPAAPAWESITDPMVVTLAGTQFTPNMTVTRTGTSVPFTFVSATSATVSLPKSQYAPFTAYEFKVGVPANSVLSNGRTVSVAHAKPNLTSATPNSGVTGGTVAVTFAGTLFASGLKVYLDGTDVGAATGVTSTAASFNLNLATVAAGAHTLAVGYSDAKSNTVPFTVAAADAPVVTA